MVVASPSRPEAPRWKVRTLLSGVAVSCNKLGAEGTCLLEVNAGIRRLPRSRGERDESDVSRQRVSEGQPFLHQEGDRYARGRGVRH